MEQIEQPPKQEALKPIILIVDDVPVNIQVLADALKGDYRIKVANTGAMALEIVARQEKPDLILLDIMMPGMDGYEVCRRLKQNSQTQNIPIIFVTARSDVADHEKGFNLGAADYIVKPFQLPIVKARVRNHLNLKQKTDLLESLALMDGLTNIPNRRRFDETLEVEWKRAIRSKSSLALIFIDIDHFKLYNDSYGHGNGDLCLKQVAQTLIASLTRPGDMIARYGGEEFVAILPGTGVEGTRHLAERLRAQVEALGIPHESSPSADRVTISLGYAWTRPNNTDKPDNLLAAADRMLYQAKAEGRNRVVGEGA